MKKLNRPTLIAIAAALAATGAHAQQAADAAPEVQSLGVVTVTGQSRVQQLQEVPITMSVISTDTIKSVGATNISELNGLLPGLTVDGTQATQPQFSIRGLGSGDFGIGTDAPVGIYMNGVYAGKTGGALLNFNDVKRIELLKGPQGTLFGRNAAAGAISIVTNEPSRQQEASVLARLGSYGEYHGEVLYNAPLNDSTAIRFTGVREHKDGWQKNQYDGSMYGGDNAWGTRLALKWNDAATSALITWEHEQLAQKPRAFIGLPTDAKLQTNPFPEDPTTWRDPLHATLNNNAPNALEARKFDGVTLRVTRDLDFATLTSTTAYRKFTAQNLQDNDGNVIYQTTLSTGNFETSKGWQQEFKLNGGNDQLDWVAGVSAYGEKATQQTALYSNTATVDQVIGNASKGQLFPFTTINQLAGAMGIPGIDALHDSWTESMFNTGDYKAAAVYGDVIWKLTPSTNLTVGARFTHDSKSFTWYNPKRIAPQLDATLAGLDAATTSAFGLNFANTINYLQSVGKLPVPAGFGTLLNGVVTSNINFDSPQATNSVLGNGASWNNTSPRLVIDHHLDKETMLFASVTRGYQAGGFNAIYKEGVSTFSPETITNYEAGVKGGIKSAGLFYTASVFHYDFNNLQSIGTTTSPTTGVLTYIVQVSDQKADGADLEAFWQIDRNWRLNAATEVINQTYKHYSFAGTDMTGQAVGTPRVNATVGLNFVAPMLGGEGSATLNWSYKSSDRCNFESQAKYACGTFPTFKVGEATNRFDLRVGWDSANKKWGVAGIVNNLSNKQYVGYISSTGSAVGSRTADITAPRAFAIEVSYKL